MPARLSVVLVFTLLACGLRAEDRVTLSNVEKPPAITPDEPLDGSSSSTFSAVNTPLAPPAIRSIHGRNSS